MATTDTTTETIDTYRIAQIEELGFDHEEAKQLSEAYYDKTLIKNKVARTYRLRVDNHFVRKMLDAGATKEQVLRVLV